jgi:N-succinyldiaminopimelate aminotransferase
VLPVNGSREALFAFAQTVIDPARPGGGDLPQSVLSNLRRRGPAGRRRRRTTRPAIRQRNFAVDWDSVPEATWARTQLVFVCSPGNPTGAVMPLDEWRKLFALSGPPRLRDRLGRVLQRDLFPRRAAAGRAGSGRQAGPRRFPRLVAFTSLSKRSNVPGMRSGFVAGDARSSSSSCCIAPTTAAR